MAYIPAYGIPAYSIGEAGVIEETGPAIEPCPQHHLPHHIQPPTSLLGGHRGYRVGVAVELEEVMEKEGLQAAIRKRAAVLGRGRLWQQPGQRTSKAPCQDLTHL